MIGDIDELLVPGVDQLFEGIFGKRFLYLWGVVVFVVLAELDDFFEGGGFDVGEVYFLLDAGVFDHIFEELGFPGDVLVDLELALVGCDQDHLAHIKELLF